MGSLACLAASVTPAVSTTVVPTAYGGRPQSPAPTLGDADCTLTMTLWTEATTVETAASLLVAFRIKNLYLSDAVALCSNCIVISIQLAFSILLISPSNSFDLRPLCST